MKTFYVKSVLFWFVLLILALFNATVRETTYKPLLTPYIGLWAHQISSITGILLFFGGIYIFLKKVSATYTKTDLILVGFIWIAMTFIFECFMNFYIRHLTFTQVLETYYFWKGETWIFVLFSLIISPLIADRILKNKKTN